MRSVFVDIGTHQWVCELLLMHCAHSLLQMGVCVDWMCFVIHAEEQTSKTTKNHITHIWIWWLRSIYAHTSHIYITPDSHHTQHAISRLASAFDGGDRPQCISIHRDFSIFYLFVKHIALPVTGNVTQQYKYTKANAYIYIYWQYATST